MRGALLPSHNDDDDDDDGDDDDEWHYSPDGCKPPLKRFHSLS
jgi:hypothetical protein